MSLRVEISKHFEDMSYDWQICYDVIIKKLKKELMR
jgi:hypothetical protein